MSSPNNDNAQYPALPGISGTSVKTINNTAVTNTNAQESVNDASATHFNNNVNGASDNAAGGSSSTSARQESSQTSTTRQTRFSTKIALEALSSHDLLNDGDCRKMQEYEINHIVSGGPDEAFGQFSLASKAEMAAVYKQLAPLVHPDKQHKENRTKEWIAKSTQAQQSE